MSEVNVPLSFSDAAASRVKALIAEEENPDLILQNKPPSSNPEAMANEIISQTQASENYYEN